MSLLLNPFLHSLLQKVDDPFIHEVFALGLETAGLTAPNPAVGALVVVDSPDGQKQIVGRGKTQPGGRPHAEDEALREAGDKARGATLYVTLEPCCHVGQGPSCVSRILESGIKRIVCGLKDPDPRMSGAGFSALEKAGIAVIDHPHMMALGRIVHAGHIKRITLGRPAMTLKLAQTSDGYMAAQEERLLISGDSAHRLTHRLRAYSDAIMVGVGTVLADDPALTVRDPQFSSRYPIRIVLDTHLRTPLNATLVRTAREFPTWIVAGLNACSARESSLRDHGVRVLRSKVKGDGLDLEAVLCSLGTEGLTSIFCEGGLALADALLAGGWVDYSIILINGRTAHVCAQGKKLSFSKPPVRMQYRAVRAQESFYPLSFMGAHDLGEDRALLFKA